MTHSPLSQWADQKPGRWILAGCLGVFTVLMTYGAMHRSDEMAEMQAMDQDRIEAQHQAQLQLIQQKALQAACGGPEATVEQYGGGYYCRDTNGRKTKTITGLARPDNTTHGTAARAKGARMQREVLKSANVNQSAGVVPAGFLGSNA